MSKKNIFTFVLIVFLNINLYSFDNPSTPPPFSVPQENPQSGSEKGLPSSLDTKSPLEKKIIKEVNSNPVMKKAKEKANEELKKKLGVSFDEMFNPCVVDALEKGKCLSDNGCTPPTSTNIVEVGKAMSKCCDNLGGSLNKCLTCGDFDPDKCAFRLDNQNICTKSQSMIQGLKILNCHCSDCIKYTVIDQLAKVGSRFKEYSPIENLKGLLATKINKLMNANNSCPNSFLCMEEKIGIDPVILDSIDKVKISASFPCDNLPKLTGLEEIVAFGNSYCPTDGPPTDGSCVEIMPDAKEVYTDWKKDDIEKWINKTKLLDPGDKECSFKTYSKEFSDIKLTIPVLFDIDIIGESNYSIGLLAELSLPFSANIGIEFSMPGCLSIARGDMSASVDIKLDIKNNAERLKLSPLKSQIVGEASEFKKKFIYTLIYSVEKNIKSKLAVDENLPECFSSLLDKFSSLKCSLNPTDSIKPIDCQSPITADFKSELNEKCVEVFTDKFDEYLKSIVSNVIEIVGNMYDQK